MRKAGAARSRARGILFLGFRRINSPRQAPESFGEFGAEGPDEVGLPHFVGQRIAGREHVGPNGVFVPLSHRRSEAQVFTDQLAELVVVQVGGLVLRIACSFGQLRRSKPVSGRAAMSLEHGVVAGAEAASKRQKRFSVLSAVGNGILLLGTCHDGEHSGMCAGGNGCWRWRIDERRSKVGNCRITPLTTRYIS